MTGHQLTICPHFCMPVVLMSWLDLEQFGVAGWMIAGNT